MLCVDTDDKNGNKYCWAYHGSTLETVANILRIGLDASDDKEKGHRFNQDARGIYVHCEKTKTSCGSYMTYNHLPNKRGRFWGFRFKCIADRSLKIDRASMKTDQWVQPKGSLRIVALQVHGVDLSRIEKGAYTWHEWDPLREAKPVYSRDPPFVDNMYPNHPLIKTSLGADYVPKNRSSPTMTGPATSLSWGGQSRPPVGGTQIPKKPFDPIAVAAAAAFRNTRTPDLLFQTEMQHEDSANSQAQKFRQAMHISKTVQPWRKRPTSRALRTPRATSTDPSGEPGSTTGVSGRSQSSQPADEWYHRENDHYHRSQSSQPAEGWYHGDHSSSHRDDRYDHRNTGQWFDYGHHNQWQERSNEWKHHPRDWW